MGAVSRAAKRRNRDATRARYYDLIEAGICAHCGQEDARPGRVLGSRCAAVQNARSRAYRARKLAGPAPVCRACLNAPPVDGRPWCQPCYDRFAQYRHEARIARQVAA